MKLSKKLKTIAICFILLLSAAAAGGGGILSPLNAFFVTQASAENCTAHQYYP